MNKSAHATLAYVVRAPEHMLDRVMRSVREAVEESIRMEKAPDNRVEIDLMVYEEKRY